MAGNGFGKVIFKAWCIEFQNLEENEMIKLKL